MLFSKSQIQAKLNTFQAKLKPLHRRGCSYYLPQDCVQSQKEAQRNIIELTVTTLNPLV